jgi:hypothetical protein
MSQPPDEAPARAKERAEFWRRQSALLALGFLRGTPEKQAEGAAILARLNLTKEEARKLVRRKKS